MRCAKYDPATQACNAPIRDQAEAFEEEDNDMKAGGGFCQSKWTNPISASYSNGKGCPDYAPCPAGMGTISQGENFTIMWPARNHAEKDQTPGTVYLYMSPVESPTQGKDVTEAVMETNLICSGPFMNCGGLNGDLVPCTLNCKMPVDSVVGIHTLWWKWPWQGSVYTTCSDINVAASSSSSSGSSPSPAPSPSSVPTPTPKPAPVPVPTPTPVPVAATTGHRSGSTTGRISTPVAATTGRTKSSTSTTGKPASSTSTSSSSSSSTTCDTAGNMKCLTSETFAVCDNGAWSKPMSCASGTTCSNDGNYITCGF